jgi:hypothetical protein
MLSFYRNLGFVLWFLGTIPFVLERNKIELCRRFSANMKALLLAILEADRPSIGAVNSDTRTFFARMPSVSRHFQYSPTALDQINMRKWCYCARACGLIDLLQFCRRIFYEKIKRMAGQKTKR